MMTISLIVAAARNNVIGSDSGLPWHLPDDLRNFKRLTTGKPIIMGRKTHESIGRPLPDRRNIVLTRDPTFEAPGCEVVASVAEALERAADADEVMIIGGGEIYAAFLPMADRIYLTRVSAEVEGDTLFMPPDESDWQQVGSESHPADADHEFAFDSLSFERKVS